MWILPKPLHTSPFVPDMAALISDSNEQSRLCAQSLLVRSKPSPARTWSLKWKRDSWTRHLYGRILNPSHGPTFTASWTSLVAATRASHSAQPASDSAPKTHDTFGRIYQPELLSCDQQYVSLKTSRDISRWGCPTSSKTWQDWVTERRGAYSARLKSARRISASGSSSWPTANARDWKDSITGTHPPSRPNMSEQTLGQAVSVMHGQAAPASSSSGGSRQGWSTPTTTDAAAMSPELRPSRIATGRKTDYLARQVQWATPQASDPEHSGPNQRDSSGRPALPAQAVQWATPQTRDNRSGGAERWANAEERSRNLNDQMAAQTKQNAKLNPRWVETLMGLPVGWVMPSCVSPVTIEPTSSDSSATELSLEPASSLFALCLES